MSEPPKRSLGESRSEMASLIEDLEKFVLSANLRGVRKVCDTIKTELSKRSLAAVEAGVLQALLGALNQGKRDALVTETVFSAILSLGIRPLLSYDFSLSIALLLRPEGLTSVCRAANEHKANMKLRALALKIFANCARDEQGARMVLFSSGGVFLFLVDTVRQWVAERYVLSLALIGLAQCALFHVPARSVLADIKPDLLSACRAHTNEVDVLEPVMCIMCLMSADEAFGSAEQAQLDEIGAIALQALRVFSLRSFEEAAASPATSMTPPASPFENLKTKFQQVVSSPSANNSSSSVAPVVLVTSSGERRCASWSLLLLGNLAKSNDGVRSSIIQTVMQTGVAETEVRYQKVLEKLLASCFDDVISSKAEDDGKDFLYFSPASSLESTELLTLRTEDDLMSLALFFPSPASLLSRAQDLLLRELSKTHVAPITVMGSRLLSLVFAMVSHPLCRARLSRDDVTGLSLGVLPAIKGRSGENGEYFTQVAKQLESRLSLPDNFPWIPYRSFPILAPPRGRDGERDFSFYEWRFVAKELCHQLTLKMEALYQLVDPISLLEEPLPAFKFLMFHSNLQRVLKQELLLSTISEEDRVKLVESVIEIASYSATAIVGNLDLTMLCLSCLFSPEISRLKLTWKRVDPSYAHTLAELKNLSAWEDLETLDCRTPPPSLLQSPRVPFLSGFLSAVKKGECSSPYPCFNWWLPRLSKNGDWHARSTLFTPLPSIQIALSALAQSEEEVEEETVMNLSHVLEPDWAIERGLALDSLHLQAQVEELLEKIDALRLFQRKTMTIESCGKLVMVLMAELGEKKLKQSTSLAVRICVERVVLGPVASLLFIQAVESSEVVEEEAEFVGKLSDMNAKQSERERFTDMEIPDRFREPTWRGAVTILRSWFCSAVLPLPSQALQLLLNLKDEIFEEARENNLQRLTAEDLIPIFIVLIVRSNVLNHFVCAHLYFVKTFLGEQELSKQGEAMYYLVTLESAIYQIRKA